MTLSQNEIKVPAVSVDLILTKSELDKAVDLCYRPQPFPNETKRIEFLFELYEKYTQPLMARTKGKKKLE